MNLFHDVKQKNSPEELILIVEIAKGDFVKYEFNHEYGALELDRVLYGPVHFPVVYADVPQTWNESDGDPLDAVFYTTGNVIPGVLVTGRVIGVMGMIDNGEEDSKIICVNAKDPRYDHVQSVDDLQDWEKKDLQTFFETYKYAQTGHGTVEVTGFEDKESAFKLIEKSMQGYNSKFNK